MTLLLSESPDGVGGRGMTFAGERPGLGDGAAGYLPSVWLATQYGNLASDLLHDETRSRMGELYSATDEAQTFIDNTYSREDAALEAYDRRIAQIHEATGVQLQNPLQAAKAAAITSGPLTVPIDPFGTRRRIQSDAAAALADFNRQLGELSGKFPGQAALFNPDFAEETKAVVTAAEARLTAAGQGDMTGVSRVAATLAGSFRGALRDPLQIATIFLGGGAGTARTVLGRIGQTIATEAIINAGVEGVVQTSAQRWRTENGLESGIVPALKQVGLAGLFGGAFGGLVRGAGEAARALKVTDGPGREALERVIIGEPQAGDLRVVADRLGIDMDDFETRVFDVAREQQALDEASFGPVPDGITADEASRLIREGIERLEADGPAPGGAVQKPARPPEELPILSEATPAPARSLSVRDKPVAFERFDPDALETDAATYQYKGGGDEAGVTDRLRGVKSWDPTASGKVIVHERADGKRYVADGHQRMGLARRIKAEGDETVRLDGYLFREADGWTAEDVRALAAKKNLQEGSGEAIDAARIMRDRPEILDDALPTTGPMIRKATGLARLSDDAWGMAVNGVVDENKAALVGELIADPTLQAAAISDLAKFDPASDRAARLLLEEIVASGVRHESQVDMFGSFDLTKTLIGERVKVLDQAIRTLKADKRLFALLAERADVIEAAGNVLDNTGNASRAVTAETVGAIVDNLARTRGPISDALNAAAVRFAQGSPAAREARQFVSDVSGLIERDGLRSLLSPPEPQLKPDVAPEPATSQAADLAGEAPPTSAELEADGQVSIWDVVPDGKSVDGEIAYATSGDLLARAERDGDFADLVEACRA
ncbi:hypothetical protein [Aurantimonas coralicida]|uniref:hypothetical protein n=1 Tax=Aurantimonas coralicida TaxID=182270 RepID=UPI0004226F7F|nr:hypothetical protein [Aurantimonas coralicida]